MPKTWPTCAALICSFFGASRQGRPIGGVAGSRKSTACATMPSGSRTGSVPPDGGNRVPENWLTMASPVNISGVWALAGALAIVTKERLKSRQENILPLRWSHFTGSAYLRSTVEQIPKTPVEAGISTLLVARSDSHAYRDVIPKKTATALNDAAVRTVMQMSPRQGLCSRAVFASVPVFSPGNAPGANCPQISNNDRPLEEGRGLLNADWSGQMGLIHGNWS